MMFRLSQVFMLCLTHSLLCATTQTVEDIRKTTTCNRTDLVIVLDSSYSVKGPQFDQAKSFLIKMVKNLTIGQEDVRVAVVRYENDVDVILSLDNSSDSSTVEEAISRMEHKAEPGTNTGKALKEVREKVLERDIKGQTAKRVVMTITDGESTEFDETEYQATQLRGEGVRLVWLFVFENSKEMEYEKNEMEKNGDPTVTVRRFDDLGDDLVSKMLEISCQDLTDTPTTAVPETSTVAATLFPETSSSPTETVSLTSARIKTTVLETAGPDTLSLPTTSASETVFSKTFSSPTKSTSETARPATTAPGISVKPAATASETYFSSKTNFPESSPISANIIQETSTKTRTLLLEMSSRPTTIIPETSSHPTAVISITKDTASTHDASTSTAGPKGAMTENSSTITPPRGKDVEALTRNVASLVTEDVKNVTDTEISERKQESIQSEAFTHAKDADRESQQSGVTEAFTQVKDVDISAGTETFSPVADKESSTEKQTSSVSETSLLIEHSKNATEAQPLWMTDADSAWRKDEDQGNHTKSEQPSPETGSTSTAFTTTSTWLERSQETVHGESVTTSTNDSETEKGQQWPIYAGVGSGSAAVAMVTAARIGYGLWRRKMTFMSNDIEMQKFT